MMQVTNWALNPNVNKSFTGQLVLKTSPDTPVGVPLVVRASLNPGSGGSTLHYSMFDTLGGDVTAATRIVRNFTLPSTPNLTVTFNAGTGTWNVQGLLICTKTDWDEYVSKLPLQFFSGSTMPLS